MKPIFNKISCIILFGCFVFNGYCQKDDSVKVKKPFYQVFGKRFTDSTKKHTNFELSFGQNLLFISNSKQINIRQQSAVIIPTSAILFLMELRPKKTLRIPIFANIATESKQFIVDGQVVNERASPTIGTGVVFRVLEFNFDKQSKLEIEIGPLASALFDKSNNVRFSPVLASRFKVCRGENFVMYFGVNYSVGINSFGVLYGTGTNF